MDDCGFLAIPQSERNRVFDVIDAPVLQVNCLWCGSGVENSQERRRGCGMWALVNRKKKEGEGTGVGPRPSP